MARKLRNTSAGIARHVVQRGNNRMPIFREHQDYHLFLKDLCKALIRTGCSLHAYVLMTNHFHLMVTPSTEFGISRLMQILGAKYVRYFNERHQRSGTLWQGRYKAAVVNSDAYILSCMRYIDLNPVRARMVDHPRDYRWSSYRGNAGEISDDLITPHSMYAELSADPFDRGRQYARWVAMRTVDPAVDVIRTATQQCCGVRVD